MFALHVGLDLCVTEICVEHISYFSSSKKKVCGVYQNVFTPYSYQSEVRRYDAPLQYMCGSRKTGRLCLQIQSTTICTDLQSSQHCVNWASGVVTPNEPHGVSFIGSIGCIA